MSTEIVVKKDMSRYEKISLELKIVSQETMQEAVVVLSEINKIADKASNEKSKIVAPLNEALKVERQRWAPVEDACKSAVSIIKAKMGAYQRALHAENIAKEAKIMARVEKGTLLPMTSVNKLAALPDAKASVCTNAGSIQWSVVKKLVIENVLLVPKEYLIASKQEYTMKSNTNYSFLVEIKPEIVSKWIEEINSGKVVTNVKIVEEKIIKNLR